jgi:hypothetical protein
MSNLQQFRTAMVKYLGWEMTPEVAAAIEREAFAVPDNSHDPAKFGMKEYKGLVFQVERIRDIVDEIHPLHEAHFAETEKHLDGFNLNADYDYFVACEREGGLIQFTCRDIETGKLVGNIRMYVRKSLHTGTLCANEDTYYVLPEFRKGFAALRFWQFMEDCLKSIGVREIYTDSKVVNKVHKLNEYCGYKHVANSYVKVFQE